MRLVWAEGRSPAEDGGDDGPSLTGAPRLMLDGLYAAPTTCQQDHTTVYTLYSRPSSCKPLATETPLHLPQQAVHEQEGLASIIPDP